MSVPSWLAVVLMGALGLVGLVAAPAPAFTKRCESVESLLFEPCDGRSKVLCW
jgi:hypothetical protein